MLQTEVPTHGTIFEQAASRSQESNENLFVIQDLAAVSAGLFSVLDLFKALLR